MMPLLFFLIFLVVILFGVSVYNRLVKSRAMVEEAWSGIDVQLKRRADLIPSLVDVVKGFMNHEKSLLENITALRARSMNAGTVKEQESAESALSAALGQFFAVAENYPELKSNENFLNLQNQLNEIEDDLSKARRYYNGAVRQNNVAVESFPSNMVAGTFNFDKNEYFEMMDLAEREKPEIKF